MVGGIIGGAVLLSMFQKQKYEEEDKKAGRATNDELQAEYEVIFSCEGF